MNNSRPSDQIFSLSEAGRTLSVGTQPVGNVIMALAQCFRQGRYSVSKLQNYVHAERPWVLSNDSYFTDRND